MENQPLYPKDDKPPPYSVAISAQGKTNEFAILVGYVRSFSSYPFIF